LVNTTRSFKYEEAEVSVTFYNNGKVLLTASTSEDHLFPCRNYKETLELTDLVSFIGFRLPSLKTSKNRKLKVKGDFSINARTNASPFLNFDDKIILRTDKEAADLLDFVNHEFLRRYYKNIHKTKTKG